MASSSCAIEGADTPEFMARVKLDEVSNEIRGLIYSIRDLDSRISTSAMTGSQGKDALAELFPSASLFSENICTMPLIYANVRDWLNGEGANLMQHSSRRVLITLATNIYNESEENQAAEDIVRDVISSGRRSSRLAHGVTTATHATSGGTAATSGVSHSQSENRLAHSIGMRFK